MVGEVHVLDIEHVRPNTEKDDFEPSPATQELEEWLGGSVWNQLRQRVHVTSSTNKAIERAQEAEQLTEKVPQFDRDDAWNNHVYELEDLARKLEHDHKNSKVQSGVKPRIDRAVKRIRAQLKKVRKAHDEWKRTLPTTTTKERPLPKQKEKEEEEGPEKEEGEGQPADPFEGIKPEMDRVAAKANLSADAIQILEACLRVLSRQLKRPPNEVRDFLDLLELELGTGG
jgi:chromosome segregation ATPase